jgi:hypothetical protein
MWIFTTFGFFSIVHKQGSPQLTVRARVSEDLDQLRERYLPSLSPTIAGAGTDYRYRATVSHEHLALAMAAIARDVDYPNFKSAVARQQDGRREAVYHKVWDALWQLERIEMDRA